jgi:hypothetical protein
MGITVLLTEKSVYQFIIVLSLTHDTLRTLLGRHAVDAGTRRIAAARQI